MSVHVCKCVHNGVEEFHLRYPGMTEQAAQELADKVNSGALDSIASETRRAASVAVQWGNTHEPHVTVNARNAASKIARAIMFGNPWEVYVSCPTDGLPRWLAVSMGGDSLKLFPVSSPSSGPDVFVKLADVKNLFGASQ